MFQIYGVKVTNGEKERRYYGDCETEEGASKAIDSILDVCDYGYAKQLGVGTVLYRESVDYRYPCAPLPADFKGKLPASVIGE